MSYSFVGGHDINFSPIGAGVGVDTATPAARRTTYSTCSLSCGNGATLDGWQTKPWFTAALSNLWVSALRYYVTGVNSSASCQVVAFKSGAVRRLVLRPSAATSAAYTLQLAKVDAAGTFTTLATATSTSSTALTKLDIHVNYSASGSVDVYEAGTLILTYSGDVTTDSATSLDGVVFGGHTTNSAKTHWSEIIVSSADTRDLTLVTLPLAANGNTFDFTSGAYSDINETVLSDNSIAASASTGQIAQCTVSTGGVGSSDLVRAVVVTGRISAGSSGPANVQANVRTSGTDYYSSNIAAPAYLDEVRHEFSTNPGTGSNWTAAQLTAAGFNVGFRSQT